MEAIHMPFNIFSKLNKVERLKAINVLIDDLISSGEMSELLKLIDDAIETGDFLKKNTSEYDIKTEKSEKIGKKYITKFQLKWTQESDSPVDANGEKFCSYIEKNEKDEHKAVCRACNVDINIGNQGASSIRQHSRSRTHRKLRAQAKYLPIKKPYLKICSLNDNKPLVKKFSLKIVKKVKGSRSNARKPFSSKISSENNDKNMSKTGRLNGRPYSCKFQTKWTLENISPADLNGEKFSSYIAEVKEDKKKAFCVACNATIDISNLGAAAINQHSKTARHCKLRQIGGSRVVKKCKRSKRLTKFKSQGQG